MGFSALVCTQLQMRILALLAKRMSTFGLGRNRPGTTLGRTEIVNTSDGDGVASSYCRKFVYLMRWLIEGLTPVVHVRIAGR